MFYFLKNSKISTKIMQRSMIIITYLVLWTNLALNGAGMMNFDFWDGIFVFWRSWEMRVAVLLLTDLSYVA